MLRALGAFQVVFDQGAGLGVVPFGRAGVGADDAAVAVDHEAGRQAGDSEGPEQRPLGVVVEPEARQPQALGEGPVRLDAGAVDGDRRVPVSRMRAELEDAEVSAIDTHDIYEYHTFMTVTA